MNTFIKYSLFLIFSIFVSTYLLKVLKIAEGDCTDGPEMCYKVMFLGSEILTMCHDTGNGILDRAITVCNKYLNIIVNITTFFLDNLDNWRTWIYVNILDIINGKKKKSILENIFSFIKSQFSGNHKPCKLCELLHLNDRTMERIILKLPTCTAALVTKFLLLFINPIPALIGLLGYTIFTFCYLPLHDKINEVLQHKIIKKYNYNKNKLHVS